MEDNMSKEELRDALTEATRRKDEALARMAAAIQSQDHQSYQRAYNEFHQALDDIDTLQQQLHMLDTDTLAKKYPHT